MATGDDLSLNSWAVLALLVDDGPQHGFALARELRRTGDIGRVWAVSRPLVYRALERLEDRGLVAPGDEEPSATGPPRQVYGATDAGAAALATWRSAPVARLRDVRPTLILKLTLARRAGLDVTPLVDAQATVFAALFDELRPDGDADPVPVVDVWRQELAAAVARTLDRVRPDPRVDDGPTR